MGRLDSAIAGVQERDKWRKRLEALEAALEELAERRRRVETRLRRLHKELARLEKTAHAFVEVHARAPTPGVTLGPTGPILR